MNASENRRVPRWAMPGGLAACHGDRGTGDPRPYAYLRIVHVPGTSGALPSRRTFARRMPMRRSTVLLGLLVGATSLAMVGEREAAACGGVFVPQPVQVTDTAVTDQRML